MLKAGKKEPFSRDHLTKSKSELLVLREKVYPRDAILMVRDQARKEAKAERKRMLIKAAMSLILGAGITYWLYLNRFFW